MTFNSKNSSYIDMTSESKITEKINSIEFYLMYIFVLLILYVLIILIANLVKTRYYDFENIDFYGQVEGRQVIHNNLTPSQRSLRIRYLLVSALVKASIWVKAPYIFALYNRLHGFSRGDIGILYSIDNVSSLLLGPFLGGFGDTHGRKKLCILYCLVVISHISLRLTGNVSLAYLAQILTGIAGSLVETAFESWLNFEANFLFSFDKDGLREKNSYLREIFSKQIDIDCFTSIILTGVASILYIHYGIFVPFYACIVFAFISVITIIFLWEENDMNRVKELGHRFFEDEVTHTFQEKFIFAWRTIRSDTALFSIGIIEVCFKVALQLFIFIWTPLLEETAGGRIHPGSVFICFMISRLIGSELFKLFKIILQSNSYLVSIIISATGCISFLVDYSMSDFEIRLLMFIYFDGLVGVYSPLFSSLKSQMIPEKLRTLIMNFFRIPINLTSVILLIATNYISTYQICLVAFVVTLLAFAVNIYLLFIHEPPDLVHRKLEYSASLQHLRHHKHEEIKHP